jgi:hypothetical protein
VSAGGGLPGDDGRPSSHFALAEPRGPKERRLRAKIAETLRAIDELHTIPTGAGRIPIRYTAAVNERGVFRYATDDGRPLGILISERGEHPALTTAHEVGHYIDRYAMPVALGRAPDQWASHAPPAALDGWATAVFHSAAVGDMLAKTTPASPWYTPDPALRATLSYTMRVEELWARSYAQWVVTRADAAFLMADLRRAREGERRFAAYWRDDDFVPIAAAIDALFDGFGWRPGGRPGGTP